jgi:hypothetical protein
MKPQKKVFTERASDYDISIAIPFSVVTITEKNEPINGHALESG